MLKKDLDPSQTRGLIFLKGVDGGGGLRSPRNNINRWGWGWWSRLKFGNLLCEFSRGPDYPDPLKNSLQIQPTLPLVKALILNNVCCRRV